MKGSLHLLRAGWLMAVVAGGCDGGALDVQDAPVPVDLAHGGMLDWSTAPGVDLIARVDLAVPVDFVVPVDSISPVDLAVPVDSGSRVDLDSRVDLVVPVDLISIDMSVPLDLAANDLQAAADLAIPDLRIADLAIADLTLRLDTSIVDLRPPPDLVSGPDMAAHVFTWKLVGTLARFPRDPSGVDYVANEIRAPQDNLNWNPMTGQQGVTNLQIGANFSRRGYACDCLINNHEYIMAGGGDGVGSPFIEPTWCDVDYNKATLAAIASPLAVHNPACAAANSLCYVIGGSSSGGGPYGSTATRVFNPQNGGFVAGPALPVPVVQASAAVGGGKILLAGGYCSGGNPCPPKNDPSGMNATVLDAVYAADVNNPVWQAQPALPRPVVGAGMVYLANRFYLVGGNGSAFGPISPNGVLSFALGENAWRMDAQAPGMGTTVSVMTDGAVVLAVVYENFAYDLYRGTP